MKEPITEIIGNMRATQRPSLVELADKLEVSLREIDLGNATYAVIKNCTDVYCEARKAWYKYCEEDVIE